jgi:hypothetical protein
MTQAHNCDTQMLGKIVNGYQCYFASKRGKGRYEFSKKEGDKWSRITLRTEDLSNGNLEIMTQHGLTQK